ncbi:TM2 domain-containing protein [Longispora urticae]
MTFPSSDDSAPKPEQYPAAPTSVPPSYGTAGPVPPVSSVPPAYGTPPPGQPYGQTPPPQPQPGYPGGPQYGYPVDPMTGEILSDKSKLVAGLLQIFLGGFGVGRFYTGHVNIAIAQIAVTWLTCGLGGLWPLIDGILILVNGGTDAQGRKLRDN